MWLVGQELAGSTVASEFQCIGDAALKVTARVNILGVWRSMVGHILTCNFWQLFVDVARKIGIRWEPKEVTIVPIAYAITPPF